MIRDIHFHGALQARFGGPFSLDAASPAEAVRGLTCQIGGLRAALSEGEYRLVRGDLDGGRPLGLEDISFHLGGARELHIVPEIAGGKSKGLGKAVLGVALVAAAWYAAPTAATAFGAGAADGVATAGGTVWGATAFELGGLTVTYGNIAMFGGSMALSGVASMLTPVPEMPNTNLYEAADQRTSYLLTAPTNLSAQGSAVPVVYGRARVGSVLVSSGVATEETS